MPPTTQHDKSSHKIYLFPYFEFHPSQKIYFLLKYSSFHGNFNDVFRFWIFQEGGTLLTGNGQLRGHSGLQASRRSNCWLENVGEVPEGTLLVGSIVHPGIQIQRNSVHRTVNQGAEIEQGEWHIGLCCMLYERMVQRFMQSKSLQLCLMSQLILIRYSFSSCFRLLSF